MIKEIKDQNISYNAFTLIEMLIVLVIIGIILMATVFLSGEQIQKVKNKTVKESILSEMQSRYSRNLGSSSFSSGIIYDTMDVVFSGGENKISFNYNPKDGGDILENIFSNNFEIVHIEKNYDGNAASEGVENITLRYSPYKISCKIGNEEEENKNAVIVVRINDNKSYCFEIPQKNCRIVEMSESKCKDLKIFAHIDEDD